MSTATIFRLPLSQIEGRLDPFFYQPDLFLFAKRIRSRVDCRKLGTLGNFQRGVVYSSEDEIADGIPVLRANNINLNTGQIDLNDLVRISPELKFDPVQKVQVGDILICAASGSKEHAGKTCFINDPLDAYIGGFMMVLRCRSSINAEYVGYYLQSSLFRKQIYRHLGGTNINNISIGLLSNMDVLLPAPAVQQKIATIMRQAYAQKFKLEAQAKALLESVDAVLYRHLGIEPPESQTDALNKRIFKVALSEVEGRFDPYANQPMLHDWFQIVKTGQYAFSPLHKLLHFRTVCATPAKAEVG